MQSDGTLLEIHYKDNGIGFDSKKLFVNEKDQGSGYFNMLSRVKSLKGKLEISSEKNKGVRVYIKLPVNG